MFSELSPPAEINLSSLSLNRATGRLLHSDSRLVQKGDVFLACQGEYADGRNYIEAAIEKGASFVFWDDDGTFTWRTEWQVPNQGIAQLKSCAGILAAHLYGNLDHPMQLWGVTGTNGKTSITQWLAQASDILGKKTAIIGTVGNGFWGELQDSTHTTPDPVALQTLLYRFQQQGAKVAALEVSSHGLAQHRVQGVPFQTAVFTNLTRDHLDYHSNMEEYGETKARLFYWQGLQHAIINVDDEYGRSLHCRLQQDRPQVKSYSYGFAQDADICIKHFQTTSQGMTVCLHTPWGEGEVRSQLLGRFNAQNLAACVGVLCANGFDFPEVLHALSHIRPATGRMDCVIQEGKPLVVVDYAHTPDALEKALLTLQEIKSTHSQLWCVFGCGGDRDRGKRPLMGEVAYRYADKVVVTSDNPRTESPQQIIDDILPAVPFAEKIEADRAKAIEFAVENAAANDVILIAGKGHETYQDIQGVKHHFSDFEVAQQALVKR